MDRPNAPTDWSHLGDRGFDFALRVQEQWPEIELGTILATHGHRHHLVAAVAATYGLDPAAADRAVAIWQATRSGYTSDLDPSDPTATPSVA